MTTYPTAPNSRDRDETAALAGDMAWGAIKAWTGARDQKPKTDPAACRDMADDILREMAGKPCGDDPAGDTAIAVLRRAGYPDAERYL